MALPSALRDALLGIGGKAVIVHSDRQAYRLCRRIAFGHYENFPVASLAFGNRRDDVAAVYAFARLADDVADELESTAEEKLQLLDSMGKWLRWPPQNHTIARALARTIERNNLPQELLERLLDAFRYDAAFVPFATEHDLLAYCANSAAPIGEILLRFSGEWNQATAPHANAFCAGLQVLNFWQDVALDWQRGRVTAPLEWIGMPTPPSWDELEHDQHLSQHLAACYGKLVAQLLPEGLLLMQVLQSRWLRWQVRLTWATVRLIWQRCTERGASLRCRPQLHWYDLASIAVRLLWR